MYTQRGIVWIELDVLVIGRPKEQRWRGSCILAYQGGCGLTAAAEKDIGVPNICLLKKALSRYGMLWYNLRS